MENTVRVICMKTVMVGGVLTEVLANVTTPSTGNQGAYVASIVGAGNPFWAWPTIPSGRVIAADFTDAPIASADPAENLLLIAAITANPDDVLTYQ